MMALDNSTAAAPGNNYIGPEELCLRETRPKYCNLHTPQRLCICYTPVELMRVDMPFCSRLLTLNTLDHLILTISLAFPMPQSFQLDPDSIFAEDLELFAGFQRNSVFIVRKGCDQERAFFQFQFGILRPSSWEKGANLSARDLRPIWPKLFTANTNFVRQKGLLIESVTQSRFLRPLIGYPGWVWADRGDEPGGWGICHRADAVDCYFWEMAFLFVLGAYLGAELTRALLWRLLWWRHGRGMPAPTRRRRRRQRRQRKGEEGEVEEEEEAEDIEMMRLDGGGGSGRVGEERQQQQEAVEMVVEVEVEREEERAEEAEG